MKRLVSSIFLYLLVFQATAQFGNEWIRYQQRYFKIPVAEDGLYRISYQSLQQAGMPASADPRTFQLFHRGAEQAITVAGEQDGSFNTGDYIEFFGRRNDGTLDSTLYEVAAHQPHRYYNLYSDTTSYFLTYGSQTGKRIPVFDGLPISGNPESHHQAERLLIMKEDYSAGVDYGSIHKTTFDSGEGWTGLQILQSQERTYVLDGIQQGVPAAGKPVLEILLTGRGPMNHQVELYMGGRLVSTLNFSGFTAHKHVQNIEWSDIDGAGKLSVKVRVPAGQIARVSASYIRLTFPQQPTMGGVSERTFTVAASGGDPVLLRVNNPPPGARFFDITTPSSVVRLQAVTSATLDAMLPPAPTKRRILATAQIRTPAWIKPVVFREIIPSMHNYVIITHAALRKPAMGYIDPVKAYAEYRSFPEGGGFDTLVVNVDQLYNQFNYGERSPRAIFQFMKYFASVKLPEYLFLVGKGLDVNFDYGRKPSAFTLYRDLVPTAGYPGSDVAYTAGLSGVPGVPGVATGRLTANTPAEVAAYLNKVRERDALPFDDLGRKRILHLSGGVEDYEPALFRAILQGFASVAEDAFLGGNVQALSKVSTDVKVVNVAEKVNQGLGLITFFGHSAPNTLDFDVGFVTDPVMGYDNAGKYPFLLMNGCNVGSFFLNADIFGENWIKTPDKGAIGFIAHSAYGQIASLQRYSSLFYQIGFGDSLFLAAGVGKVQQELAERYFGDYGITAQSVSQIQQMVLLGDPAVKLFGAEKPDYGVDASGVTIASFDGEPLTALSDSFRIYIPVWNSGVAWKKDFRVEVSRLFQDGSAVHYDSIVPAVLFQDTLAFTIRNTNDRGFGANRFTITIDADDIIDELDETNNTASFEYFIPLNSTRNLYPYDFSVVRKTDVDVSFQHTDLLSGPRAFLLEIDTTDTFDSDYKKQFHITATVLARQRVELLASDSTVYYWRTKLAQPLEAESGEWKVSSFTYIFNGSEGWAQLRYPQYATATTNGLTKDPMLEKIELTETVSDLSLKTFTAASGKPRDSVSFKINGVEFNLSHEGDGCRANTLNLVAFDKRSTQPYAGIKFKWYELLFEYGGRRLLCGREPYIINSFTPSELVTGNEDDLIQYIDNVEAGDSVVLFSIGDAGYSLWPAAAKAKLGEVGISAAQLADFQNGDAVIIFGRKNAAPGTARIFHATSPAPALSVKKTIAGRFTAGSMSSTTIGPARSWGQLIVQTKDVEPSDNFSFTVVGISADMHVDTLKTNVASIEDLSDVDALAYPYLRIVFKTGDGTNLTAAQLKKWMVTYEPVPDGLLFYRGTNATRDVMEGEPFSADYGFVNYSDKSFSDSLTVRYDLKGAGHKHVVPPTFRINAPAPGDTTLFRVIFNTTERTGLNDVDVFVNPEIEPENVYENNWIVLREHLNIRKDLSAPVLDVTFDGRYPEDNDFVSANPDIAIRLWDDNPFILNTDTLNIRIFLARPCAEEVCGFERIYFSRDDVSWEPASATSDFTVHFSPSALADGRYVLRIEASDARGNTSGEIPYEISFRVLNARSLTVSHPYPNPFFYEAVFEMVITDDDVTDYGYKLVIMDLNGKIVMQQSGVGGALHIGKNYIGWSGYDSAGKLLPGGIYLYKLAVGLSGGEEKFFGKIVLQR